MIINGKHVQGKTEFDVTNPYTGQCVGQVPIATKEQLNEALERARDCRSHMGADKRAKVLQKTAEILQENKQELARLITDESGLCLKDTLHEVDRTTAAAKFSAQVAERIEQDTTSHYVLDSQDGAPRLTVVTEPMDLVVAITPFNHPLNQVAHKVFPAVAAGVSLVLKPSEKTPLSAIRLAEILLEAGLEKNMVNVVTGNAPERLVEQLVTFPDVDMVTFTGGRDVGVSIVRKMTAGGNALKKYVPELGGCSSLIVHEDADLDRAVAVAVSGCFKNSGQRCTAIRRVIVHARIADAFVERIAGKVRDIRYGDPYDPQMDMGTVISQEAAIRIEERVSAALKDGADLICGHQRNGALLAPTVLDKVGISSELVTHETFGPVCPIIRAHDIDEAITLADQTPYGLAGAVVTKDRAVAEKVFHALEIGQFSWNGIPGYRTEAAPFGGFRDSGNGEKEGVILAAQGMRRIRTFYEH